MDFPGSSACLFNCLVFLCRFFDGVIRAGGALDDDVIRDILQTGVAIHKEGFKVRKLQAQDMEEWEKVSLGPDSKVQMCTSPEETLMLASSNYSESFLNIAAPLIDMLKTKQKKFETRDGYFQGRSWFNIPPPFQLAGMGH